ncbi:MAG: cytochrome c biogenesis protein [Deltaproteobacteria bacterium]|nr:cytochrome c biogenesis protein [Deltaproteobacteria bacterium]
MHSAFNFLPIGFYLAGWLGEFLYFWSNQTERKPWSDWLLAVGWGGHTLVLVAVAFGDQNTTSMMLSASSWVVVVVNIILIRRLQGSVIGLILPPLSIALLLTSYFSSTGALIEAGHTPVSVGSGWELLFSHIITVLTGILLFGLASAVSILYLYQEHNLKTKHTSLERPRLPSLGTLEKYNHKLIALGFFFLSIGILLGVVVAGLKAQPVRVLNMRQIIPLVVWLFYASFLLVHDLQGRRGSFGAYWSVGGFVVALSSLVFELIAINM